MLTVVKTRNASGSSRWCSRLLPNLLLSLILILPMSVAFAATSKPSAPIPQKDAVGAAALPAEIAPVKAPFSMPQFRKPIFPALSVNITEKGAKDGAKATAAIQAAIDDVTARG